VSVVMPAYNCERYVLESASSILRQTISDLELIVVDDCSTDRTADMLAGLCDPRLKVLRAARHQGQTACINLGLAAARGVYVARQDADDIATPSRLKMQARFLDEHPGTMMVGSSGWTVDASGGAPRPMRRQTNPLAIRWGLLFGTALTNLMWRRDWVARNVGQFSLQMSYAEDYDFVARVASVSHVANLPARLMMYRRHPDAIGVAHREGEDAAAQRVCLRQLSSLMGTEPASPIAWIRAIGLSAPESVPAREMPGVMAAFGAVHDCFESWAAELPYVRRTDLMVVRRTAGRSMGVAIASACRRGVGGSSLAAALGWRNSAVLDAAEEMSRVCLRRLRRMTLHGLGPSSVRHPRN